MIKNPASCFFLILTSFYCLTAGGHFYGQDGVTLFEMSKQLIWTGGIHIPYTLNTPQGRWAENGLFYSPFSPGQPVTVLPLLITGMIISTISGIAFMKMSIVVFFNVFVSAGCITLVYLIAGKFYKKPSTAFLLAIITGTTTLIWPYSKYFYTEPLITLCLLGSFYLLLGYKSSGTGLFPVIGSGLVFGWLVLSRPASVLLFPGTICYLYLILGNRKKTYPDTPIALPLLGFGFPAIAIFAGLLVFNYARFNDFLAFGYTVLPGTDIPMGFHTPVLRGLYIFLLSPGKSLFLFSPAVIMGFFGLHFFSRKYPCESLYFIYLFLVYLILYAGWIQPEGGYCWGPRFLVPTIPFLIFPAGIILENGSLRILKPVFVLLCILGFFVQIAGISVNFSEYIYRHNNEYYNFETKSYDIHFSPLPGHVHDTLVYVRALPEIFKNPENSLYQIRDQEILNWAGRLDFWWVHFIDIGFSLRVILAIMFGLFTLLLLNIIQFRRIRADEFS